MAIKTSSDSFRVGLVLIDDFPLMAYASAVEPLRAANLLSEQPRYHIRHIPLSGARSASSTGAMVGADAFIWKIGCVCWQTEVFW